MDIVLRSSGIIADESLNNFRNVLGYMQRSNWIITDESRDHVQRIHVLGTKASLQRCPRIIRFFTRSQGSCT